MASSSTSSARWELSNPSSVYGVSFFRIASRMDNPEALIIREGVAVFLAPGGIPNFFDHESVNQVIQADANSDV